MKAYKKFLALWLVNAVLLYLAAMLFPSNYTLGNNLFSPIQAVVFTGFVWNFIIWHTEKLMKEFEIKLEGSTNMMLAYLLMNFASLWLLARFAFLTGFGISSWVYVLLLAVVANFVQYLTWQSVEKK